MRTLDVVKPFVPFLPEVASPGRKVLFQEKFLWTSIAVLIFLVCSQIPLFGIMVNEKADPVYWIRAMMAGNRGTLMDLGLGPIIMAGTAIQFLTFVQFITIDENLKEDRVLLNAAQKLLSLIFTFGHALVQVATGFFGSPGSLGLPVCVAIVVQLLFSGVIIILLDELLQKGYGLGSGVNLFIAANLCESIVWKAFSPSVYNTGKGPEFEGAIIALVHLLKIRRNKLDAVYEAMFRKNLPNLTSLFTTAVMFAIVVYMHGMRVELPVESTQTKGQKGKWPIKLFYTSNAPVIFQGQMIANFCRFSQVLCERFPHNFIVRLLGVWDIGESRAHEPVSGVSYFISPPSSLKYVLLRPVHFIVYVTFMLATSALFSKMWAEVNDSSTASVVRQMKDQKMVIKGHSFQGTQEVLEKYIPTAAMLGGLSVGGLCILSDLFDTIGSGTNIILAVSIVWQYFELFTKERLRHGGLIFVG